jgi:hypothetical protein
MLYSLFGLFLKRETLHGFNRVVLLAILVASMVLPLCQIETPKANIVTKGRELLEQQIILEERIVKKEGDYWITNAETEYASNIDRITNGALAYDKTPLRTKGWNWVNTLLLLIEIYAVGVLVYWFRYFWQLAALLLLIHQGKRIEVEGLPKHVRVIVHPDIKTPSSWMRWIILNLSDVNTRAIINHELAHIRLGHSWDMLLCEFTCRMLWCVPFAWMLRQDLRDVHEYQADRRVLATGIQDEEYQLLLIKKATGTGLQPVVNALNQSPIKRRFKMMYKKPSRRWVALKAAYLLPLSLIALMAFARPQTMSELEQKVEKTETEIAQVIEESGVIDKVVTLAEELGLKERETESTTQSAEQEALTDTVTTSGHAYLVMEHEKNSPDANLVKADLVDSQPAEEAFVALSVKRANELLDSTMQAVGARKIADGTWIGHFQPSLNNDTVRVGKVEYLDKQSRQTGKLQFSINESDPYAYNMILQDETRKERTGYYIRKLYPAKATDRQYDQVKNDPKMLSTDDVLTKRDFNQILYNVFTPVAIEQSKKDTRIFLYVGFGGNPQTNELKKLNYSLWHDMTLVDENTGDQYVWRFTDFSYFKYVKDEYIGSDTVKVYQTCVVFPPLSKKMNQAHFGNTANDDHYSQTFNLKDIPHKGRVITN